MAEADVIAKKWGSSIGVVIPKEIVEKEQIKESDKIRIDVKKGHKAKEFFGLLKGWKKSTQDLKNEARKGWE